ncbi:bifunctional YncE family protein/alkaline phosphatase family protein [Silvibacterium acidisoli]|uniref:bifunctional YncE family protein/alkaline phosphatase family protein n=1 Tax=Acidobacteriaceae bacterium ZG23-2 TaxID=2883246 RepID=UPI00406D2830
MSQASGHQDSKRRPEVGSGIRRLTVLSGLLCVGLSGFAQSVPFPTYTVGPQPDGSYVVSDGTIITPAGTQVDLGIRVRAKAVALNPTGNHTAAVLTMGTSASDGNGAVEIFNTKTGAVLQSYNSVGGTDSSGSHNGISYTPDGKYLLFSQDSSYVAIAKVAADGKLSDYAHVSVPINGSLYQIDGTPFDYQLSGIKCYPDSSPGTDGSYAHQCGHTVGTNSTSYPLGLAVSPDGKTAYSVLDVNDTLTKIDLTSSKPMEGAQIRVGNVPHSVVISSDGRTAYVSNEAGRLTTKNDRRLYSDGTPVATDDLTGATTTGTVSVVDLSSFRVVKTINTGLHPTGMAFWGRNLLVANAYDDTISVIDTGSDEVVRTINLALPIKVPGEKKAVYGAGPNSIAVDTNHDIAYVALYNANAVAVVDLNSVPRDAVLGLIPTAYAPSSIVLDQKDRTLIVANDKGVGSKGIPPQNSFGTAHGVTSYNTHQDLGTVSIIPLPDVYQLADWTNQVYLNNHWDLKRNIRSAGGGDPNVRATVLPKKIGDPSLIKHVFLIIRENRTYDQILGDVDGGNGDPSLAVFGAGVTPNAHTLVQRFPLLDNFYDPSRQSADGHNWIVQAMAPYSDDIQSPDWVRDYPSNGGDAIAYQKKGHLWDQAVKAGVRFKNFGEYIEWNSFDVPGCTPTPGFSGSCHPTWSQFYDDTLAYESGKEKQLKYFSTIRSHSPLHNLIINTVQNYPQFDLDIPDQYRVDIWKQDFEKDVKGGTVPQLSIMWISSDHTGGPPTAQAMEADNDLAVGRFVDIISHSSVWSSSAIFVEEDDAQDGVDHVDGHRSPGYVISPYVRQGGVVDSTYYTQVNMTRTIEQILGLPPMNQFDLVASPMKTLFVDNPPADNFKPWTHVANLIPLDMGVTSPSASLRNESPSVKALRVGWMKKKTQIFAGKHTKPDSEDPDTVNHLNWYEATGFSRPYPGEAKVRPPSDFNHRKAPAGDQDDD